MITREQLVDDVLAGKPPAPTGRNGASTQAANISDPVFTAELDDSYRMEWLTPAVTIRLEDVRGDRRTGDVKADVDVEALGIRILQNVTINLKASTTRAQLAKHLTELSKGTAAASFWSAAINDVCGRTVRAFREGAPSILLREALPPAASSWALFPLALADQFTLFFGDVATTKSMTGLGVGLTLHTGLPVLGLKPGRRMRVALADWESVGYDHRGRMVQLLGPDVELPDLEYIPCDRPLRDEAPRLQRIIREKRIEFLIIDSVGFACDGPPEEAQSALAFGQALRSLHVGSLGIAHVNRTGDTERPFGSIFWHAGARLTWYVKKVQDQGAKGLTVGLFNKKSSTGPLERPLGFRFEFDDDRTRITRTDVRAVPELAGQIPLKDRMAHALKGGMLTYPELAEILEVDVATVGRVALRYQGRFFTVLPGLDGKKRVGLAQTEPDTVRSDTPDTVHPDSEGNRTDTPPLSKRGVSGPLSDKKERTKAPTNHCACGALDWNLTDVGGWRCGGCGQVKR